MKGWVALAASALLALPGAAAEGPEPRVQRLVRVYDWAGGFPWSYAALVEQDRRGFLWLTTTSGLFRFDGTRARRVSDAVLAPGGTAAGRVIAFADPGGVFEATAEGLVRLDRGPEEPRATSLSLAVASDGTPWRVRDGAVARLARDGTWTPVPLGPAAADPPRTVHPGRDGRVYLLSRSRVWVVEREGGPRPVASVERPLLALEREDGTVLVGANQEPSPVTTRVFAVTDGTVRLLHEQRGARLLSLALRRDALWVSTDLSLQALGPDGSPRDRLAPPAVPALGSLLVDREGSLWMATARGLVHVPEPDVHAVQPATGGATRDLARAEGGVWGTFWGTLGFLSAAPGPLRWTDAGEHFTRLCRDGAGRVWTARGGGMVELLPGGSVRAPRPQPAHRGWDPENCGSGPGGRLWIVSRGRDLWTVDPGGGVPRPVPVRFDDGEAGLSAAAGGADGTLWVAREDRVCRAPAADVLAGRDVAWTCERGPDGRAVEDLQATPGGDVWAVEAAPGEVHRRLGGRWEVIPGSRKLGASWVSSLTPSPSGGLWLTGPGLVVRVAERTDLPDGWEVLERLTARNGLISPNVATLEEDADGTLWLAADVGLQRIPPEIRRRRADPPGVEIVEVRVDGSPVEPHAPVRLPWPHNRLEAHFAALTYRDPGAVRYRMRLHGDHPWSAPAEDGRFTFVDLPAGRYALEVAASLDGAGWSEERALLAFDVRLPWYARPWFLAGSALGIAGMGHLGYRLRVRRRLARERQRTRIAMDLHDEVGSGLGTIAVLAGIVGREDVPPVRRGEVAARIAAVSQELARSLGDIVWSLRSSSGSLDALWDQLLERARPAFAAGAPRIEFEAPAPVPPEPLPLVVRRNLHLVVFEALHNAARHAGARRVVLRLARDGAGWRLEVEDDGRGLPGGPAPPSVRRGLGLEAMRARVAEMRGTLAWERGQEGGTRVVVRFRTGRE